MTAHTKHALGDLLDPSLAPGKFRECKRALQDNAQFFVRYYTISVFISGAVHSPGSRHCHPGLGLDRGALQCQLMPCTRTLVKRSEDRAQQAGSGPQRPIAPIDSILNGQSTPQGLETQPLHRPPTW
jgi:hypothetical protein